MRDTLSIERASKLAHIETRIDQFQKFQTTLRPHFTSLVSHAQHEQERERALNALHHLVMDKFKVWQEGPDGKGAVMPITREELEGFKGSQEEIELTDTKIRERLDRAIHNFRQEKELFTDDLATFVTHSNAIATAEAKSAPVGRQTLKELQKPCAPTKELLQSRIKEASQLREALTLQMTRVDRQMKLIELNRQWLECAFIEPSPLIKMERVRADIRIDFQGVQKLIGELTKEQTILGFSDERDEEEAEETRLGVFIWHLGFRHSHFKERLDLDFPEDKIDLSVFYHWGVRLDEVKEFTDLEEFIAFIRENFKQSTP